MAKRKGKRANGEGSIIERADGRWEVRLTIGYDPLTGKPKRKSFYGKTQKEAKEKRDQYLTEIRTNTYVEPNKTTLDVWIAKWLELYARPTIKDSTYAKYYNNIHKHIIPALGAIKLQELSTDHVQQFYNELAKIRSSSTVAISHQLLSRCLDKALKQRIILTNPTDDTVRPTVRHREIIPLTPKEVNIYLNAIKTDRLFAAFLLDFYTGLRRGELLALQWGDITFETYKGDTVTMSDEGFNWKEVDPESGMLHVRRSLGRVTLPGNKGRLVFSEPKTAAGKRIIPLLPFVAAELKTHKARQAQEKLKAKDYQDDGLVFATRKGKPIDPQNMLRKHKKNLKRAGLRRDVRLHDIRHTFGTILAQSGENPKNLQLLLGHTNIKTTLGTYCHSDIEDRKRAITRLATVMKN